MNKFLTGLLVLGASAHAQTFRPAQPDEVRPGMAYNVNQPTVEDDQLFAGKHVAILTAPGVQDIELTFPYEYLRARGAEIEIFAPEWVGSEVLLVDYVKPTTFAKVDGTLKQARERSRFFDLVLVPGGAWASQVLRKDADIMAILQERSAAQAPIAIICSAAQVLIDSGLAQGRRVTGTPSVKLDLVNAGGIYVDEPAVLQGSLLMSRSPNDLEAFVGGIKTLLMRQ